MRLFIYWLHWVLIAVRGLFSNCGKRGLLFLALASHCWGAQALGAWAPIVVALQLQ